MCFLYIIEHKSPLPAMTFNSFYLLCLLTFYLTPVSQWDVRTGEVVQEYDRHLGAVNTITFVDENRRFVSTSDDKSLRVWEW